MTTLLNFEETTKRIEILTEYRDLQLKAHTLLKELIDSVNFKSFIMLKKEDISYDIFYIKVKLPSSNDEWVKNIFSLKEKLDKKTNLGCHFEFSKDMTQEYIWINCRSFLIKSGINLDDFYYKLK